MTNDRLVISHKSCVISHKSCQAGVSLYMALMVMTMLFGIGLGMSSLLLSQLDTLKGVGFSVLAFYATDTGVERAIYEDNKECAEIQDNDKHVTCLQDAIDAIPSEELTLTNGATFTLLVEAGGDGGCPETSNYCVKSVGVYQQTRRAVRIAR